MTNLRSLDLSHNIISKIENLEYCINLSYLNLGFNKISNTLDVNFTLGNIRILILKSNGISELDGLDKLYTLEKLDLSENLISTKEEIIKISELPFLNSLFLEGNPVKKFFFFLYLFKIFFLIIILKKNKKKKKKKTD